MTVRVLLGSAVSAAAVLLWGFLFWVVLSPPGGDLLKLPDEPAMMQALRQALPASGSYYFPLPPEHAPGQAEGALLEAFRQQHIAGPVGMLHFNREGVDPLAPWVYVRGFAHAYLSSLIAALLLLVVLPVLESLVQRAAYVFGLGVFAVVAVHLSDPVWWHLPWEHFLFGAVFHLSSWLIAGIVLAATVRPPRGAVHLTDPSKPLWKRALDVD